MCVDVVIGGKVHDRFPREMDAFILPRSGRSVYLQVTCNTSHDQVLFFPKLVQRFRMLVFVYAEASSMIQSIIDYVSILHA